MAVIFDPKEGGFRSEDPIQAFKSRARQSGSRSRRRSQEEIRRLGLREGELMEETEARLRREEQARLQEQARIRQEELRLQEQARLKLKAQREQVIRQKQFRVRAQAKIKDTAKKLIQIPSKVEEKLEERREKLKEDTSKLGKLIPVSERVGAVKIPSKPETTIRKGIQDIKTAERFAISGVLLIPQTARLIKQLAQNPELIVPLVKSIPSGIKNEAIEQKNIFITSPNEFLIGIGNEVLLMKGTSKGIKLLSKQASVQSAKLSPKFVGKGKKGSVLEVTLKKGNKISDVDFNVVGKIANPTAKKTILKTITDRSLKISKIRKRARLQIADIIKGTSVKAPIVKTVKLKVIGKLPRESIKKQLALEGKKVIGVSAQADRLIKILRRKRVIRKPFLGEDKLSLKSKSLLSKFDKGSITKKQLIILEGRIKKEAKTSLIERSFFADPKGRIRPSRLGTEKEASLTDLLKGDFTFKTSKPQILVFDNIKIQKFPKDFSTIKKKLSSGKTLTQSETNKLLRFQLKKSGKFKPLGFISKESEITLAPSETIKKLAVVGKVIINNRVVPIVQAKVIKLKGSLKKSVALAEKGKLNKKQLSKLNKDLKKKTGFEFNTSSKKISRKTIPIKRLSLSSLTSLRKRTTKRISKPSRPARRIKRTRPRKIPRRIPRPKPLPRPRKIPRRIPRPKPLPRPKRIPRRTPRPSKPSKVIKPLARPSRPKRISKPARPFIITSKKKRRIRKPIKKKTGYLSFIKRKTIRGKKIKAKFLRLNKKPLSKSHAKNRASYIADRSTARTLKIKRVGKFKKLGRITKREANYFKKTKRKYRPFKIRKGIKKPLTRKWIERKKYLIDTRSEKRGLRASRVLKQLRSSSKPRLRHKPMRRSRPTFKPQPQRKSKVSKIQLDNLKKGREKLARMRKAGKR